MRPVPNLASASRKQRPHQPPGRLPVALADQLDLVNQAVGYFSDHFSEANELESMAEFLGVNGIAADPQRTLQQQVDRCGLVSVMVASQSFEELFGIGLVPFRRLCRRAVQDRQMTSMNLPYPNRA